MYACLDDVEDIIDLMVEAHNELVTYKYSREKASKNVSRWIVDPKSLVLVNNNITACYILTFTESWYCTKPFISDMFLYSKTTGGGYRLVKDAQKWIKGWGDNVAGVLISTRDDAPIVDKIYKKLGYKIAGTKWQR